MDQMEQSGPNEKNRTEQEHSGPNGQSRTKLKHGGPNRATAGPNRTKVDRIRMNGQIKIKVKGMDQKGLNWTE